jgi:tetratricopeptide (TPR) repeat protein
MPTNKRYSIEGLKNFDKNSLGERKKDTRIENFNRIDDGIKDILNLFAQMPFLDDIVAKLLIEKYFQKDENILNQFKLLLYLTNTDSEFWTIKEWVKKEIKYKEFDYNLLNSLIEKFISEQKDISKSKALKYLLIQSRLLLHTEGKAKIVTEEFSKAIKDSKEDMKVMKIVDSQLEEFISLSKDSKSEAMRDAYFLRAKFLRRVGKTKESQEYLEKVIKFPQEDEIMGEAYQLLGHMLYKRNKSDKKAENYLMKSLNLLNDDYLKSKSYSMLGNFHKKSNFNKAKYFFDESMLLKKEINDLMGQSQLLHGIGNLYKKFKKNFDKAREFFDKSLIVKNKINDREGEAKIYLDMGLLYFELKNNIEKAEFYFNQSLEIEKQIQNKKGEAQVYRVIARIHENTKNDCDKIKEFLEKSLHIEENINIKNNEDEAQVLFELGKLYSRCYDKKEAKKYCEKSLKIYETFRNRFFANKVKDYLRNL